MTTTTTDTVKVALPRGRANAMIDAIRNAGVPGFKTLKRRAEAGNRKVHATFELETAQALDLARAIAAGVLDRDRFASPQSKGSALAALRAVADAAGLAEADYRPEAVDPEDAEDAAEGRETREIAN